MSYQGMEIARRFFAGNETSYDSLVAVGTVGADRWWKEKILDSLGGRPRRIIDQACGTGILTFKLARKFPRARIIGVDLHAGYIQVARQKAAASKQTQVDFIAGRAEEIFIHGPVNAITSSYLAKYADLGMLVSNAESMLSSGGILAMHDFTYPSRHLTAAVWEIYFRLLRSFGRRHYPGWKTVFAELPALLRASRWPQELLATLHRHAFKEMRFETMTFGSAALITCRRV